MTDLIANIIPEKIPQHLAIIMDGNGRWAKVDYSDIVKG
jgi:undecaprenyl diphosphate synthase